jgi:hypothetical protein
VTGREQELIAREMLAQPELLGIRLKERRWEDVAALVRYVKRGVPTDLAMTDPALYKTLRDQITVFHLRGGGALNLEALERLAKRAEDERGSKASAGSTPHSATSAPSRLLTG